MSENNLPVTKIQLRYEIVFFLLLSASITILLTVNDMVIFDNYVLKIMEHCYPGEISDFCNKIREALDVTDENGQLEIGRKYWNILTSNFYVIGLILTAIRITTPVIFNPKPDIKEKFFLYYISGKAWKRIYFVMGTVWFFGLVTWYMTGWLDTAYYALRHMEIPESLFHLDGAGFFQVARMFTGSPEHVEKSDLFILNGLGIVGFVGLWYAVYKVKKRKWADAELF